jgi:hypothetical protein
MKKQHEWEGQWGMHLTAEWRRQGASAWLAEHHGELDPAIEDPETGIPDATRAETLDVLVWDRNGWRMPDKRILPWFLLLIKARTSPPLPVTTRDISDDDRSMVHDEYFFQLDESKSAVRRRLFPRKRTCFGMTVYLQNRLKLWEWAKTTYTTVFYQDRLQDCDSYWFPYGPRSLYREGFSNKERYRAHRLLYPLTGPEKISTGQIPHHEPFPRERHHTLAGHGAEKITHHCPDECTCDLDWRIWQNWRPWQEPSGGWSGDWELERWEPLRLHGKLTLYLKRLLWEYKGTEPQMPGSIYKDWRSVNYFRLSNGKERLCMGKYTDLEVKGGQSWWVRYWEKYFHTAKVRQIEDSPGDFFSAANVLQHLDVIVVASPSRNYIGVCCDLDQTTIRRKTREKKVPGYKLHDSAADVMKYLGCSRATAFRRIKEGFRIPTAQSTTQIVPK